MISASSLETRPIRTVSGQLVGRLDDLRCARVGSGSVVTHLVYGRRGFLERLGFRGERNDTIPWSRVVEFGVDVILIADGDLPEP